jgi:dynactin complex subunit
MANAPVLKADLDTRVSQYVKLRDKIKELDDKHKEAMAPMRDMLEQLNSVILQMLKTAGVESARTNSGTAYVSEKRSASIADADAFWSFVVATGDWDLIDRRANVTAVYDFIQKQAEAAKTDPNVVVGPPPGVNFATRNVVGVRRA